MNSHSQTDDQFSRDTETDGEGYGNGHGGSFGTNVEYGHRVDKKFGDGCTGHGEGNGTGDGYTEIYDEPSWGYGRHDDLVAVKGNGRGCGHGYVYGDGRGQRDISPLTSTDIDDWICWSVEQELG